MRVWIDQDLCTGDGLCEEIAPDVFFMFDDGLAYVRDPGTTGLNDHGRPLLAMASGMATIPDQSLDAVVEAAEECPRRVHLHRS